MVLNYIILYVPDGFHNIEHIKFKKVLTFARFSFREFDDTINITVY